MAKIYTKQLKISGSDIQVGIPSDGYWECASINPSMSIADAIDIAAVSSSVISSSYADYALTASYALNAGGISSYWTGSDDGSISRKSNVKVTGSLYFNDPNSRLYGTASWSDKALTASYADYATSSSFAETAKNVESASSALWSISSSFADSSLTGSSALWSISSSFADSSLTTISASYAPVEPAFSESYSSRITVNETDITALQTDSGSFSTRVTTLETDTTASFADSASEAFHSQTSISSSYADYALTAQTLLGSASYAITSSYAENVAPGVGTYWTSSAGGITRQSNVDVVGDLNVSGKITAEEFHTQYVSASIIYSSGSTKFGDTADDIHQFTGSFRQSGSATNYFRGNVGIGTTNPQSKLHVIGNQIITGSLHSFGKILVINTGSTITPVATENLQIRGNIGVKGRLNIYGSNLAPDGYFEATNYIFRFVNNPILGNSYNKFFEFIGGKVIHSSAQTIFYNFTSSVVQDTVTAGYTGLNVDVREISTGSGANKLLSLKTSTKEKMYVDNEGNISGGSGYFGGRVGIGTTNPQSKLHVIGNQIITGSFYQSGSSDSYFRKSVKIGSNAVNLLTVTGSFRQSGSATNYFRGNVGIGTITPSTKFQVAGVISGSSISASKGFYGNGSGITGNISSSYASRATTASYAVSLNPTKRVPVFTNVPFIIRGSISNFNSPPVVIPDTMTSYAVRAKTISGSLTVRMRKNTVNFGNPIIVSSSMWYSSSIAISQSFIQFDTMDILVTKASSAQDLSFNLICSRSLNIV